MKICDYNEIPECFIRHFVHIRHFVIILEYSIYIYIYSCSL